MKTKLNIKVKSIQADDGEYYNISNYSEQDVSILKLTILHKLFNNKPSNYKNHSNSYGLIYTKGGFVGKYFRAIRDKVNEQMVERFYEQVLEDSIINMGGKDELLISVAVDNKDKELLSVIKGLKNFLQKVLKNSATILDIYLEQVGYTIFDVQTECEKYDARVIKNFALNLPMLTNSSLDIHYYNVNYQLELGDNIKYVQRELAKIFHIYKGYIGCILCIEDGDELKLGDNLAKNKYLGDLDYGADFVRIHNCFWVTLINQNDKVTV